MSEIPCKVLGTQKASRQSFPVRTWNLVAKKGNNQDTV